MTPEQVALEWVKTHGNNALDAMQALKRVALGHDDYDKATYWQHEINALVKAIRGQK